MAYKKRDTWYAYFVGEDGKSRPRATSARSAKEADRFAERENERVRAEMAEKARRRALGDMTWGELLDWHHAEEGRHHRSQTPHEAVKTHIRSALENVSIYDDPAGRLESRLNALRETMAPASLNRLRGVVHSAFEFAVRRKRLPAPNPIEAVKTFRVGKAKHVLLNADELSLMLGKIEIPWQLAYVVLEAHLATRKGELFALRVADVDETTREIKFRRGKVDDVKVFRVPDRAWPHLMVALARARDLKSDFVFCKDNGAQHGHGHDNLVRMLRSACARAGLITGYRNVCRRKGCKFADETPEKNERPCPKCTFKLLAVPVPKAITVRGLRKTVITIADRSGAPLSWLQDLAGHSSPNTTKKFYIDGDAKAAERIVEFLPYTLPPASETPKNATGTLPEPEAPKQEGAGTETFASDSSPLLGRPDWFRTNDLFRVKGTTPDSGAALTSRLLEFHGLAVAWQGDASAESDRNGTSRPGDATRNATRTRALEWLSVNGPWLVGSVPEA